MNKTCIKILFTLLLFSNLLTAQENKPYDLAMGLRIQKTNKLYLENGLATDFSSQSILNKKLHLKLSYVSSRFGSAVNSNAIKQDNYIVGLDWRFRSEKDFQIFTGINSGFFHADMEDPIFDVLPHNSLLFSAEVGAFYKFKFPMAMSCSAAYNIINGNGIDTPGTLYPFYCQLSAFYFLRK
jgi:hypothetical protein